MIKEFNINIPEDEIKALKQKISLTRWPDELDNENWTDGTNMKFLKNLCAYWVDGFDWKKQEDILNKIGSYKFYYEDNYIHFLHSKSSNPI